MILKEEQESIVDYYQLRTEEPKTVKKNQHKSKEGRGPRYCGWSNNENYAYITYLKNFKAVFTSPQARKRLRVFSRLSKLIKTRTTHQIKSHHQKMMMRLKTTDAIVNYLKFKILKSLKDNPNALEDIEAENQKCEAFFLSEANILYSNSLVRQIPLQDCSPHLYFIKNILIKPIINEDGSLEVVFENTKIVYKKQEYSEVLQSLQEQEKEEK